MGVQIFICVIARGFDVVLLVQSLKTWLIYDTTLTFLECEPMLDLSFGILGPKVEFGQIPVDQVPELLGVFLISPAHGVPFLQLHFVGQCVQFHVNLIILFLRQVREIHLILALINEI